MASLISSLLKAKVIPEIPNSHSLFNLLSLLPKEGRGMKVLPKEWAVYDQNSFYEITHVTLSPGLQQGIVSGVKFLNGKPHSTKPEPIPQKLSHRPWIVKSDQ